jgi:hypothetical protein
MITLIDFSGCVNPFRVTLHSVGWEDNDFSGEAAKYPSAAAEGETKRNPRNTIEFRIEKPDKSDDNSIARL